jgi:HEAT repeat protein
MEINNGLLDSVLLIFAVLIIGAFSGIVGTMVFRPWIDRWTRRHRGRGRGGRDRSDREREARPPKAREHPAPVPQRESYFDAYAQRYINYVVLTLRDLPAVDRSRPHDLEQSYIHLQMREQDRLYTSDEDEAQMGQVHRDPNEWFALRRTWREGERQRALLPQQALMEHGRCILLGGPGSGKTTMLRYLAFAAALQQMEGLPHFPILISLQRFVQSGFGNVLDYVVDELHRKYGFRNAREYVYAHLESGDVLLLFDGLDAVGAGGTVEEAEGDYKRAVAGINRLAARYPRTPIMVTSRLTGWRGGLASSFHQFRLLEMNEDQIRTFVEHWFVDRPTVAERLLRELVRNPRVEKMSATPLLLSLLCMISAENLELPKRRVDIYGRAVDVVMARWDADRPIQRRHFFSTSQALDLLSALAWQFQVRGQRTLPQDELLGAIARFLPELGLPAEINGEIMEEIVAKQGFLTEQEAGWYGYLHPTMQEYFAAREARGRDAFTPVLAHVHHPWWQEIVLFLASMGDATRLLRGILSQPEDIFWSSLRLAGRCMVARPRVNPALRSRVVGGLQDALRRADNPIEARLVAQVLAELGGEENNTLLLSILSDRAVDVVIRWNVADVLGSEGERDMVPRLVTLLEDEELDPRVRGRIADALGALGVRSIAPQLVDLLENPSLNTGVRESIAGALGSLGVRKIVPRLVELVEQEDLDAEVRSSIVDTLGMLGEPGVAPRLVALLEQEALDARVLSHIAAALGLLGEREVAPRLVALLSSAGLDVVVRWKIADALVALGDRRVVPQLVALLRDESLDIMVRVSIADALVALGERSIAPQLVELLAHEELDPGVRWYIAGAVGELGERSIAPQLVELLENETLGANVRLRIADALGDLGERRMAPRLVELLANKELDAQVQESIASALGKLGDREVAPRLAAMLGNDQLDARLLSYIAAALGEMGDRGIVPRLVEFLGDESIDVHVRERIADALGALRERSIAPRLVELLQDESVDFRVRRRIADAVGALGDLRVTTDLVSLLDRESLDVVVRWKIVDALVELGDRGIAPELVALLGYEALDVSLRRRITDALVELGVRGVAPRLVALLEQEDFDADARRDIANVLGSLGDTADSARALAHLVSTMPASSTAHQRELIYSVLHDVALRARVRVLQSGQVVPLAPDAGTAPGERVG